MPSLSASAAHCQVVVSTASDSVLMTWIAAGDAAAFDEIHRRHSRNVQIVARKLCASRELAEEVAQETFVSLWRSAHRYRPSLGGVGVWLASMARNRAIDVWRRAAVRPVEVTAFEHGSDQLHSAIGAETPAPERAVVLGLIAELPAGQKEAVFLAYFAGMTHVEIADWAGAPLGTIKGRIRLGLAKLREGLAQQSIRPATLPEPEAPPRRLQQVAALRGPGRMTELESARRRRCDASSAAARLSRAPAA
jgi:RNA polymerase sigma-70 factor (ECF subfamily)